MEILSYLRQNDLKGEIIHGNADYIAKRIVLLAKVGQRKTRGLLEGCRLGVIGQPSDWLISSQADYAEAKRRLGIELVDIPMQALLDIPVVTPEEGLPRKLPMWR